MVKGLRACGLPLGPNMRIRLLGDELIAESGASVRCQLERLRFVRQHEINGHRTDNHLHVIARHQLE